MEPSTFSELSGHAKWLGSSITLKTLLWRVRMLFYPLGPVYWLAFALAALLALAYPPALIFVYAFLLITLVEFMRCVYLTRMVLPSIGYVFFISPARMLLIVLYLLRSIPSRIRRVLKT